MSAINSTPSPLYYVGVDGGGTHCRASIYDNNLNLIGRGHGGPANPVNGLEIAQRSIMQSIDQAITHSGIKCSYSHLIVGAGLAGLHLPSLHKAMSSWSHPFKYLAITDDAHIAVLGAHNGNNGAIIILGTGFSAVGIKDEKQVSIGGYGFPINAVCSGSWFGLEIIKAVLLDFDQIGPETSMTKAVIADESPIELATRLNNGKAFEFAKYAPLVFKHAKNGDVLAQNIIKLGTSTINKVIEKFISEEIEAISFVGGVAPHIVECLDNKNKQYIVPCHESPEYGAMIFAKQKM
ncbi:BadF/BadG/BcrA/BcrD ATPase family protein [Paraglaciecola sp. L3A3]|uniref:BadF/BadG/BcrA/BcrD ATPase family protein n=1 Tax=Paraglaciecola sp. L3A3 TaxID=2686358 RepID=UPI00131CD522|nr:BadF/BadG/BcrA/BcrD ATPase family protein [Paraglaciecola sp. L3A3]